MSLFRALATTTKSTEEAMLIGTVIAVVVLSRLDEAAARFFVWAVSR